jgi:hypothetical protein
LKRRVEREENNKKKRSKNYRTEKPKKLGRMVAPVHNFDPKILPEGSAKLRWAMRGAGGPLCSCGKKKALDMGSPSSTDLIHFLGVK